LPFNRPAVFIEFGEYELQDMGGYVKGPVPITLHVVQDMVNQSGNVNSTQDTKYQAKLKYPSLIQELLHQYRISNCILDVKKPKKDPDAKNLMVYLIEITARVRVPRRSSSLPAETPLSAFSYSNASQTIDEGNPITTITATTTGDVARFVVDINSTIISGLVLDPTSGQISGTPTAEGSFKVAAISQYGQVIGVVVVTIAFTGATTPVTSLTYSNDEQTIYEETGDGAFVPMFATTDPAGATGSYSSVDLPDGLSLNSSTSEITAETFGDIPAGENTFTVTFTGSGDYSGTADYEVTVTKRELWEPTDLASGLEAWWDFTEDGTVTLDTYEGASVFNQVNDLSGNN
ncbi:MAG: Ig domain-containing protein, partial [Pseudomonadales bacterium]